ncbi:MAG: metallophosphoesterase family protein [Tepidanaerobacteraceae bacterium]|nr:metallophosphoesterase [Thermoanaerobacterales bacterium]
MIVRRAFIILICSIITPLLFIHFFDSITVNFQGLELVLGLEMALKGSTTINLPPIGILKAFTHQLPININISLQNIDLDLIKVIIDKVNNKNELFLFFKKDAINAIKVLIVKTFILGTLGTIFASLFMKLKKKELIICIIISLFFITIFLSSLYISYDISAFDKPEYFGTLKAAPWIISIWNKGISQINELRQQLKSISEGISTVFLKMDNLASTEESVVRVLHVSDIHNNIAAFDFMEQIIFNFNVDVVIDTGDITDYGTSLENMVIEKISHLPVDYVFCAGNHDSPKTVELMEDIDNVIIPNGGVISIKGINILAFSDPISEMIDKIDSSNEIDIIKQNLLIRDKLNSLNEIPDILAVHNPQATENLEGFVPIILNGHTHKTHIKDGESLIINAGSTGAAGIRGIQSKADIPYSAVLLYFKSNKGTGKPQLFAADIIKISNVEVGFQVERVFFNWEDVKE